MRDYVEFRWNIFSCASVHAPADAKNQNPDLDFFDCLGNPIPNGDTPDDKNENDAEYLTGVEECDNQHEIPGEKTPNHREKIPGVTTTEEEEENKEISGVHQNTENPGVNINNAMPGNPLEPTSTNDNNTPKLETVDESDAEEDENVYEEAIKDEEGFEFQVNSPAPAEQRVSEASQIYGLRPRHQPSFEHRYPSDHYTNLMVHVFTQMNLNQGLKIFGNAGMKATKSEIQQMHDKVLLHPIKGEQLTNKQNTEHCSANCF